MADIVKVENLDVYQLAASMATAGYWADVKNQGQALAKILAGYELGFGPVASLSGIHIIEGKPTIGAHLIAAQIRRSGRYDYRVAELTDRVCRIVFTRTSDGMEIGESTYSVDDAQKAKLFGRGKNGGPGNWERNPRNMLFARAISNGVKWHCPEILLGAYATEEMEEERSQAARGADRPEGPAGAAAGFEDADFTVDADPQEARPVDRSTSTTAEPTGEQTEDELLAASVPEALRKTIDKELITEWDCEALRREMYRRIQHYGWTRQEFYHLLKQYDYTAAKDIEPQYVGLVVLDLESAEDLQSIRRELAEITAAEMDARAGFSEDLDIDPHTGEIRDRAEDGGEPSTQQGPSLDEEFGIDRGGDKLPVNIEEARKRTDGAQASNPGVDAATAAVAKRRAKRSTTGATGNRRLIEDKPETPAAMLE